MKSFLKDIKKMVVINLLLIPTLFFLCLEVTVVDGQSMKPTLNNGDLILVEKISRYSSNMSKGSIILFSLDKKLAVKRVVSTNGSKLFVEGDNKLFSKDSRNFGEIDEEKIVGRVVGVIYPLNRAGLVR